MTDFNACPKGHALPHKGANGECTPLRCAAGATGPKPEKPAAKTSTERSREFRERRKEELAEYQATDLGKADADEERRIAIAAKRHEKWMDFLGTPTGLTGDEAEKWADGKLVSLLPIAVAQIERSLKYGTEDQKDKAADKILNATGRGKREALGQSTPPIVIQLSGGGINLPWRQTDTTVNGEVTKPTPLPDPDAKK